MTHGNAKQYCQRRVLSYFFMLPMATQLLLEALWATQVMGATQRAILNGQLANYSWWGNEISVIVRPLVHKKSLAKVWLKSCRPTLIRAVHQSL